MLRQGKGLTKTAKKLNLKLSTAKLILRKYKQTGQFHMRRLRQDVIQPIQTPPEGQENALAHKFDQ